MVLVVMMLVKIALAVSMAAIVYNLFHMNNIIILYLLYFIMMAIFGPLVDYLVKKIYKK